MGLELTTSTSDKAGRCNGCDDHMTPTGGVDHAVIILSVGYGNHTTSLRFCERCFARLKTLVGADRSLKVDRRLSCPVCATIVEQFKGTPMPDECPICGKKRPAWRSKQHPRFGQKGD